ncbi:MAG TPA: hypothetical protein VLA69_13575 [Gaiellaceae bacterium]|nr:hypothetical protein [Gaiellaceae bacterium]
MASRSAAPRLSDEEVARLLALLEDADSVELKLTVPEADQRSTVTALALDPLDAEIRQVFFFDTPDLTLNQRGLVVRARRVQGKGDDSVVKLRPVVPSELPRRVRRSPGFAVEVDAMPGGFVCSGSMKHTLDATAVKDVASGGKAVRKLFSKDQRAFFHDHAPAGIGLDDLSILGPIFVLKLKYTPKGLGRRLVAELWLYPDDTRILELSTKCTPEEAFDVAARARAFLGERGVSLAGDQQTKTRAALEFFARRLEAGASDAKRPKATT